MFLKLTIHFPIITVQRIHQIIVLLVEVVRVLRPLFVPKNGTLILGETGSVLSRALTVLPTTVSCTLILRIYFKLALIKFGLGGGANAAGEIGNVLIKGLFRIPVWIFNIRIIQRHFFDILFLIRFHSTSIRPRNLRLIFLAITPLTPLIFLAFQLNAAQNRSLGGLGGVAGGQGLISF